MIIESGRVLFSKHFYENIDVKMIVETCKIPRGSFYAYFTNIEDYYFTVIKSLQEQRINKVNELSDQSTKNYFDFLIELFTYDIQASFLSKQKLLIQHYFRYIQTQRLGFHKDEKNLIHHPIFDVLSKYNVEFKYEEVEWNEFIDFCMSIYLSTYMKAMQDHKNIEESINMFKERINIVKRGVLHI